MTTAKYSLLAIFTVTLIIIAWIFFTSNSSDETPETKEIEVADNKLYNQLPKDNDADYTMPVYVPTHSQSQPRAKVEFKTGGDNDALYSMPVSIPPATAPQAAPPPIPAKPVAKAPVKATPAPEEAVAIPVVTQSQPKTQVVDTTPVAPLQPRARQPETPVYTPEYQQQQSQQPQYQQPQYQQSEQPAQTAPAAGTYPEEDVIPYYYY